MKKREKQEMEETRRHKALRRTMTFLAVAVAVSALHLYGILPTAGLRYVEGACNTGRTHIVRMVYDPVHIGWRSVNFLSANENAVLLTAPTFHVLYGWLDGVYAELDCSRAPGAPVHGAVRYSGGDAYAENQTERKTNAWAFGRVDDSAVAAVEVRYCTDTGTDAATGKPLYADRVMLRSERAEWTARGEYAYFLLPTVLTWKTDEVLYAFVLAYDAQGTLLGEYDTYGRSWSS